MDRVRATDKLRAKAIGVPALPPVPVQPPADNGGFIYAPSLAQASTSAVLRSGFMTHQGTPDEGLLSLDVSSDRVRKALSLLDGVRQARA